VLHEATQIVDEADRESTTLRQDPRAGFDALSSVAVEE
jgi:hypothetical protein